MTREVKNYAQCQKCSIDATCPKCGGKIERFTPFSNWLRALPAPLDSSCVSLHNLDFIWHYYKDDWFITIEEKQHGGECSDAQHDTHGILFQFLRIASEVLETAHGHVLSSMRGQWKKVEYRGHYVIVFEKTHPDDSKWILAKKRRITKDDLLSLLRTGRLPEEVRGK